MTIGGYKVIRKLGSGGMSEVFEVEHPRLGSRHALKLFSFASEDASVRARFESEGLILARLRHPRIIRVTEVGVADDNRPYFVMDLVLNPDGMPQTLAEVPAGSVDEPQVGRWYDDIREGLAYIHGKGIVHRDLKLQNVMIDASGHAVIADFGISKVVAPSAELKSVDPVQTIIGLRDGRQPVMGSLGYMAPEVEMGLPATEKSDLYALGVIVFKLLTGDWCDARTDVKEMLASFDPVWPRLVPKLLHSNPEGRECLSYEEAESAERERLEKSREDRQVAQAACCRRCLAGLCASLCIAAASLVLYGLARQKAAELSLRDQLAFSSLFATPPTAAPNDADDDSNPTTNQFELAQVDAWVVARPILERVRSGGQTPAAAADDLQQKIDRCDWEGNESAADGERIGDETYFSIGEPLALRRLMEQAVEKLREISD